MTLSSSNLQISGIDIISWYLYLIGVIYDQKVEFLDIYFVEINIKYLFLMSMYCNTRNTKESRPASSLSVASFIWKQLRTLALDWLSGVASVVNSQRERSSTYTATCNTSHSGTTSGTTAECTVTWLADTWAQPRLNITDVFGGYLK